MLSDHALTCVLSGHSQELCLDAVLQTMVSTKKPGSLFPLMRYRGGVHGTGIIGGVHGTGMIGGVHGTGMIGGVGMIGHN